MPKPFTKNDPRINRNGRPKKDYCLSQGLRDFMFTKSPDQKKEIRDIFIEKVYNMATNGDIVAIRLILNYTEGVPRPMLDWEVVEKEKKSDAAIDEHIQQVLEEIRLDEQKKINEITKIILDNTASAELSEETIRKQVTKIIVKE